MTNKNLKESAKLAYLLGNLEDKIKHINNFSNEEINNIIKNYYKINNSYRYEEQNSSLIEFINKTMDYKRKKIKENILLGMFKEIWNSKKHSSLEKMFKYIAEKDYSFTERYIINVFFEQTIETLQNTTGYFPFDVKTLERNKDLIVSKITTSSLSNIHNEIMKASLLIEPIKLNNRDNPNSPKMSPEYWIEPFNIIQNYIKKSTDEFIKSEMKRSRITKFPPLGTVYMMIINREAEERGLIAKGNKNARSFRNR